MSFNPCDRATWPEVLYRTELAAILRCSPRQLDRKRKWGETPPELTSGRGKPTWGRADVIRWLEHRSERRGFRRSA